MTGFFLSHLARASTLVANHGISSTSRGLLTQGGQAALAAQAAKELRKIKTLNGKPLLKHVAKEGFVYYTTTKSAKELHGKTIRCTDPNAGMTPEGHVKLGGLSNFVSTTTDLSALNPKHNISIVVVNPIGLVGEEVDYNDKSLEFYANEKECLVEKEIPWGNVVAVIEGRDIKRNAQGLEGFKCFHTYHNPDYVGVSEGVENNENNTSLSPSCGPSVG